MKVIDRPDDPDFDAVFQSFSTMFHGNKNNFETIMRRNTSNAKEIWVYIKDHDRVIAVSNFAVFVGNIGEDIDGTLHGIYTFVMPEFRRQGNLKRLISARENIAYDLIKGNVISFIEQNSPKLMTPEQYEKDTKRTMDQRLRRRIYEDHGFGQLDFRYIQPAFDEQPECEYLDLCVKGVQTSLPTAVVKEHLTRFFKLSFPVGTTLEHESLVPMMRSLDRDRIDIIPKGRFDGI